jgi:hypothetical protein
MLYIIYKNFSVVQGSEIDVATCYGLDVRGSNPGGREIFRARSRQTLEPTHPGLNVNHIPPSSSEVKRRVELYLCILLLTLHGLF